MQVEGKGCVSPSPVRITLDKRDTLSVRVFAKNIAARKGWSESSSLIGFLGEAAVGKYVNDKAGIPRLWRAYDFEYIGDGGVDISVAEIKIQIKTQKYGKRCQIKRTANKKLVPLICDLFVFCKVITNLGQAEQKIDILGWIDAKNLQIKGTARMLDGDLFTEIDTKYLEGPNRLVHYIIAKTELGKL